MDPEPRDDRLDREAREAREERSLYSLAREVANLAARLAAVIPNSPPPGLERGLRTVLMRHRNELKTQLGSVRELNPTWGRKLAGK